MTDDDNDAYAWWRGVLAKPEPEPRKAPERREPDPWQAIDPWSGGPVDPWSGASAPSQVQQTNDDNVAPEVPTCAESEIMSPKEPKESNHESKREGENAEDAWAGWTDRSWRGRDWRSKERNGDHARSWNSGQDRHGEAARSWSGGKDSWRWSSSEWRGEASSKWRWNNDGRQSHEVPQQEGDGDQDYSDQAAAARRTQMAREFADWQTWYEKGGTWPRKTEAELLSDEEWLFQKGDTDARTDDDRNACSEICHDIYDPEVERAARSGTFEQLFRKFKGCIPDALQNNIQRCEPGPLSFVQKYTIPAALLGRDVICNSKSLSGKASAFLIPFLASTMRNRDGLGQLEKTFCGPVQPDVLILTPSRYHCNEVYKETMKLCHRTHHRVVAVFGQEKPGVQLEHLAKGADVLVATPGRLWDFVKAGVVDLTVVNCLVIDDVDKMTKSEDSVHELLQDFGMPSKDCRQTLMFYTSLDPFVRKLADECLYQYVHIRMDAEGGERRKAQQQGNGDALSRRAKPERRAWQGQDGFVSASPWGRGDNGKLELIESLLCDWSGSSPKANRRLLIFVNTRARVKEVCDQLSEKQHAVEAVHGEFSPEEVSERLKRFHEGLTIGLILTDAASRWLDRESARTGIIFDVVNLDLPIDVAVYLGRIEHTGYRRGDAKERGRTMSFIEVDEEGRYWDEPELLQALPTIVGKANAPDWLLEHSRRLKATGMCGVFARRPMPRPSGHNPHVDKGNRDRQNNSRRPVKKPVNN